MWKERTARLKANEAALAFLSEVDSRFSLSSESAFALNTTTAFASWKCARMLAKIALDGLLAPSYQRLQQDALDVERRTIIRLRDEFVINDEVLLAHPGLNLDDAEARLHVRA